MNSAQTLLKSRWQRGKEAQSRELFPGKSCTFQDETPPRTPTPDSTLQDLIEEKTRVQAECRELSRSPKMLLAHRDLPLSKAKNLEGTLDRLIQIQSQHTSPNSTLSPIDVKASEDESEARLSEYPIAVHTTPRLGVHGSESPTLLLQNRTLESLLSDSQRKIQELVSQNSDLSERIDLLQNELKLTIITLEQCRDFKLSCSDYIQALEQELSRIRKDGRPGKTTHIEEILQHFAERIEMLEVSGNRKIESLTEEKLREIEEAAEELTVENSQLKTKMQNMNLKQKQMKTKLMEMEKNNAKLMNEKQTLESSIEKTAKMHQSELKSAQQRLKSVLETQKTSEETIKSLTNEVNRLKIDLQNSSIPTKPPDFESNPPDTQIAYLLLRKENEEMQIERKRSVLTLENLQKQVQKMNEEIRIERENSENSKQIIADLMGKKTDCDKIRAVLKKEENLRKRFESELQELKSTLSIENNKQNSELETTNSALKASKLQLKRATDKLQHLQSLREQMQNALTAATTQVTQLQEQVTKDVEIIREKDKNIGKLERKIDELEAEIRTLHRKCEGFEEYEEKLKASESEKIAFQREIHLLKSELRKKVLPENKETAENRGYFENWLQSLSS